MDQCCEVTLQLAYSKIETITRQHRDTIRGSHRAGFDDDPVKLESYEDAVLDVLEPTLQTFKISADRGRTVAIQDCLQSLELKTPRIERFADNIVHCEDTSTWDGFFVQSEEHYDRWLLTQSASETLMLMHRGADAYSRLNHLFNLYDYKKFSIKGSVTLFGTLDDYSSQFAFDAIRHKFDKFPSSKSAEETFLSFFAFRASDEIFLEEILKRKEIDQNWLTEAFRRDLPIDVYNQILPLAKNPPLLPYLAHQDDPSPKLALLKKFIEPNLETVSVEETPNQIALWCVIGDFVKAAALSEKMFNWAASSGANEYPFEEWADHMYGVCALYGLNSEAVNWGGEAYEFDTVYYDSENANFFAYHGYNIADYYDHEILWMPSRGMYQDWFKYKFLGGHNSEDDYELAMNGTLFSTFEKLKFQKYRASELARSSK